MNHHSALRLSVVIPVCGEGLDQLLASLLSCLRSLNRQTLPPTQYEVLLVGDVAADLTLPTLRCRLRSLSVPRPCSPAKACNLGVQAAVGEVVLFLRPDVLVGPDCLRPHLETHSALPQAEYGVLGRLDLPASGKTKTWSELLTTSGLLCAQSRLTGGVLYGFEQFCSRNLSLPRRSIVAAGMFDEQFCEPDWGLEMQELGLRLQQSDVLAVFVPGCVATLHRLPTLNTLLQAARQRGADTARLQVRQPSSQTSRTVVTSVDLHFWRNPPARLIARVQALADRLARLETLTTVSEPPSFADPTTARAALSELETLRTRDILALIEPLEQCSQDMFNGVSALPALLLLDAFHACLGYFATAAASSLCTPQPTAPPREHVPADTGRKPAGQTQQPARPRGRVLLATNYFWPSVGGTELLVEELGLQLMAAGYAVDVACRYQESRVVFSRKGMTIHDFRCTGSLDDVGGPDVDAYRRQILSGGYTAVIALSHPHCWCCSLLRTLPAQGRPRIIMMPSMNADDLARWKANGEMEAIAEVLRAADIHVTVSERGVDAAILERLGLPHRFLPHAVTSEASEVNLRERWDVPEGTPLLACVGNFWPVKNQLGLLRSMITAPGDWRLALAGAPAPWPDKRPYFMECWELSARDPRTRMVGPMPPLEAAALIRQADILLLPSIGESAGPLVVLQAMAMGTPWVATPACNAVHDEAGGLIVPLERFPQAVEALLARPEAAWELGALGREHWQRCFTWEQSLPGFIDLIEGREDAVSSLDLRMPDDLRLRWQAAARAVCPDVCFTPDAIEEHETGGGFARNPAKDRLQPVVTGNQTWKDIVKMDIKSAEDKQHIEPSKEFLFSVITAAYNAAHWIEAMLSSLVQQELDFAANIEVIVVDDGSTDQTADIIKRWIEHFPGNILLRQKENGGPASAKNLGMDLARGKWVTFIDADDFIARNYFQKVNEFLLQSGFDGNVVACNTLLFIDGENYVVDGHPLAYKFKETRVVDLLEEPIYLQLFANTCLIRRKILDETGVRNDERIKPTFDDAHFINMLLLMAGDFRIAFLKEAHYYYRRRGVATGLAEGGWADPKKYRDQVLFGYLDIVRQYKRILGHVPAFVQNLVLYEGHWYMMRLLGGPLPCNLSEADKILFFEYMFLVFQHVTVKHILLSTLPALELRTRIAILLTYKREHFNALPFIVAEVAPGNTAVRLVHWATDRVDYRLQDALGEVPIPWEKRVDYRFGDTILCHEYHCWVPLRPGEVLWPEAEGTRPGVFCRGQMLDVLDPDTVHSGFYLPASGLSDAQRALVDGTQGAEAYRGCWVLMDRIHTADDSAEHFCRWLLREHPGQRVYFVLDGKAADWKRLEKEGFPLLSYGSEAHYQALANAQWLVSSHVDQPVIDPVGTRELFGTPSYKVAFLQHGIIKDDLSHWLNHVSLDLMVVSTQQECASLLGGRYKFTEREILLSGLPRHDALLKKTQTRKPGRTVLFCPTWRQHLRRTEAHISGLNAGEARIFQQSDYFKAWSAVTGSRSLAALAREYGYKLLFLPHPEVARFLSLFPRTDAFSFLDWASIKSVQDIIASSAVAVTDYSSLAFDISYAGRAIAYYQFPETPDIHASQAWQRGYFDYEIHGLGPVLHDRETLEAWLRDTLHHGCARQEEYEQRAAAFFTLRDGQNCRRVYEGIIARS